MLHAAATFPLEKVLCKGVPAFNYRPFEKYKGVNVKISAFLTLEQDSDECSASYCGRFMTGTGALLGERKINLHSFHRTSG